MIGEIERVIRWRATDPTYIPEQVECDIGGFPNVDADGKPQYENTHFDTESEAWASGFANVRAAARIDARLVREADRVRPRQSRPPRGPVIMSNDETTTATPLDRANVRVKDGAIQLTMLAGDKTALLTVRGKDHDLTSAECRELAKAFDEAAKLTALSVVIGAMARMTVEEAEPEADGRDEARELARRWPWSLAPHEKARLWTLTAEWMENEKRHGRIESDLGEWLGRDIDDAHHIAREAMEAAQP